jgi:hypothetical protein
MSLSVESTPATRPAESGAGGVDVAFGVSCVPSDVATAAETVPAITTAAATEPALGVAGDCRLSC